MESILNEEFYYSFRCDGLENHVVGDDRFNELK